MKHMEFEIVKAGPDDLKGIHEVEEESFSDPWSVESFRGCLGDEYTTILIAKNTEENDEIMGFMIYSQLFEISIDNIAIRPKYRRNKIAEALLSRFSKDIDMTLEVEHDNEAAKKLYEKFGFEIVSKRKDYYGRGRDAYIMWRKSGKEEDR